MVAKYCHCCWAENRLTAAICQRCGAYLAQSQADDFVTKLIAGLRHSEPLTRRRAAWILGELHEPRALEPLMAALQSSRDPDLLEGGVEALGKIGDRRAVSALAPLLATSYLSVRLSVVRALGQIGGPEAAEILHAALGDASGTVREDAEAVLKKLEADLQSE